MSERDPGRRPPPRFEVRASTAWGAVGVDAVYVGGVLLGVLAEAAAGWFVKWQRAASEADEPTRWTPGGPGRWATREEAGAALVRAEPAATGEGG